MTMTDKRECEQCEVCEKTDVPLIAVEVSDEESPPRWLGVCSEECLQHVIRAWHQIGEVIRPKV